jgi:hypothetical protein
MKNEINLTNYQGTELIIREGVASKPIEPIALKISGTIETPMKWIEKKSKYFEKQFCSLQVDRESGDITLTIREKSPDFDEIVGKLEYHPDFTKFMINTGKQITSHELAELIKMNRSCFADKETAMKLVKELRNFKAKVEKELESIKDDRANYSMKKIQAVETNIPDSFILVIPIFKGQPKESFEVEININAENYTCSLVSPVANDFIAEFKDRIFDQQIELIQSLVPELVIIEV